MSATPPPDSHSSESLTGPGNNGKEDAEPEHAAKTRRSLPRRSKKRANYKEPSEDELEANERVPVNSKKPRLDRDQPDSVHLQHVPPYQGNIAPPNQPDTEPSRRDSHPDMAYHRQPVPRMHLPEERNYDPRLGASAPMPHASAPPYPSHPPYHNSYERRPSYGPEPSYINGGAPPHPMESPNQYIFDNRGQHPAHPSPYEQPQTSQSYFHPPPPPPPAGGYPPAGYYSSPPPPHGPPGPSYGDPYMYSYSGPNYPNDGRSPTGQSAPYPPVNQRMTASPRPDMGGHMGQMGHPDEEAMMANSQWTSDAHAKISNFVRRKCFNCGETATATWRRSTVNPGKVLCNKCGLFERTHHKARPPSLNEDRSGGRARMSRAPPHNYNAPPPNLPPTGPPPPQHYGQPAMMPPIRQPVAGPGGMEPVDSNGRLTPKTNGHSQRTTPDLRPPSGERNIDPRVTLAPLRPPSHQENRSSPSLPMGQSRIPQPQDSNLDPRLGLELSNKGRISEPSIPSLSEMMANAPTPGESNGSGRFGLGGSGASRSVSANNSGRGSPVTLPPISALDTGPPPGQ